MSQGSAEGVLGAFLHKTYTRYYYTRENEGAIQVDDTIPNLEGCNYVSFQNLSHGGKIFFGFIDRLVYINDNNTEIQFTIDPFPTYLGDTTEREDVYVIRNTPKPDSPSLIAEDFDFQGRPYTFATLGQVKLPLTKTITIFTGGKLVNEQGVIVADTDDLPAQNFQIYGFNTGLLYIENMNAQQVKLVTQAGGSIIGVYAVDASFNAANPISTALTGTVTTIGTHNKLMSGQYNKISVVGCGQSKSFDLDKFSSKPTVGFYIKRIMSPTPTLAVYPLQYEGIAENTAEGFTLEYPMLATSVTNYRSISTNVENLKSILWSLAKQAGKGDTVGDVSRMNIQRGITSPNYMNRREANYLKFDAMGLTGGYETLRNMMPVLKNSRGSMANAEINTSAGGLVLTDDNNLTFDLILSRHNSVDITALDDYFEYFGYSFNQFMTPNTDDKAYLQTGNEFVSGSEADVQLNNRIMEGIKIRKTLS